MQMHQVWALHPVPPNGCDGPGVVPIGVCIYLMFKRLMRWLLGLARNWLGLGNHDQPVTTYPPIHVLKGHLAMNLPPALRKTPTRLIVTAAFTLSSASAHAVSYLETFDSPLNPAIWNLTSGGNDWTISGGKLTITRNNGNNGSLTFLPQVIGDFDVRFDYDVQNWTNTNAFGDRIQLGVFTGAPQHSYGVVRPQEGSITAFAVDPNVRFGSSGPGLVTGTFRITRTGSNVSMQYLDNSSNWITLQTGSDSRDMWVQLDNYIHQGFIPASSVVIDNFSITAQQFSIPIPEPETYALFLAGLGLVGFAVRRRKPAAS